MFNSVVYPLVTIAMFVYVFLIAADRTFVPMLSAACAPNETESVENYSLVSANVTSLVAGVIVDVFSFTHITADVAIRVTIVVVEVIAGFTGCPTLVTNGITIAVINVRIRLTFVVTYATINVATIFIGMNSVRSVRIIFKVNHDIHTFTNSAMVCIVLPRNASSRTSIEPSIATTIHVLTLAARAGELSHVALIVFRVLTYIISSKCRRRNHGNDHHACKQESQNFSFHDFVSFHKIKYIYF
jgi:hypothetical protein